MALSRAAFLVTFPEFENTATALIDAKLAEALAQMHAPTWGALLDSGQANLTAALLQNTQKGLNSRLQSDRAQSTYRAEYERIRALLRNGPHLIATPQSVPLLSPVTFIVGDGTSTEIVLTHAFATRSVLVNVYTASPPFETITGIDIERPTINTVLLRFQNAPATGEFIAVISLP